MKKYLLILCFVLTSTSYSQGYYPSLETIFLTESDADESLFKSDLLYLKVFLKEATNRMYLADLQANVAPDNSSSFYSLSLIPRGSKSNPFLDTGINLLFDPKLPVKLPKINVTLEQSQKKVNAITSWNGHLMAYSEGLLLEFPSTMIIPLDSNKKNNSDKAKRTRFMISRINYELSQSKFVATLEGKFNSFIKLSKNRKVPKTIHSVSIEATKDLVTVKMSFTDKKNKNQTFTLLEKKVVATP